MTLLVSIEDIRNKNKDLLNTDGIPDEDIETAITDAQIDIFNALGGIYDETAIDTSNCPDILKLAIKFLASGNLIIDNYPDQPESLKVGIDYKSSAMKSIKNIVDGNRRLNLAKDNTPLSMPSASYTSYTDKATRRAINKAQNSYYRY